VPVRVKLKVKAKSTRRNVETVALVNSGFITEKPQLLIPKRLAEKLGIWPPPPTSLVIEFGTAGGPIRNFVVPEELEVNIVEPDRETKPIICDAVISHVEEEVLINDKLGEELGIIILGLASGKWKLIDDPADKVRKTYPPQYW